MRTDDNPADLEGQVLARIETKDYREEEGEWDTHEIVFLEIATEKESITVSNHVEHNGYYGGFGLTITEE